MCSTIAKSGRLEQWTPEIFENISDNIEMLFVLNYHPVAVGNKSKVSRGLEQRQGAQEHNTLDTDVVQVVPATAAYSQYSQRPVSTTKSDSTALVTPWARMQSPRLFDRTIHQL